MSSTMSGRPIAALVTAAQMRDLEAAALAAGVDLAMPDDCLSVQGRAGWKVPKKAPKPHQRAWALIQAAERFEP